MGDADDRLLFAAMPSPAMLSCEVAAMVQLQPTSATPVSYPDCDGNPMADNTEQFRWIVVLQQNLEWLFADDPTVFVAGDLLWYPIEGDNKTRSAPDVMVILGRPKGDRGSYKQWLGACRRNQKCLRRVSLAIA
jgi:hypothetical protein